MRRHNTGSGDPPAGGPYHRMGSPPPHQSVPPSSGMSSPEPHLTQSPPPSFSPQQTHPALQQFLMGTPLQGINIGNLRGQPVLHTRISPTAVSPGVLPIQTGKTPHLMSDDLNL